MEIWREVLKNLNEYYEKYILEAFLQIINSNIYSIPVGKIENDDNYNVFELMEEQSKSNIKVLLFSVTGDVKAEDVNFVSTILSNDISINLAILLTGGDFSKRASELLEDYDKYSLGFWYIQTFRKL